MKIHFEDKGQDLLWWELNDEGEVTNSNMQEWLWKGCKVCNHVDIKQGDKVDFLNKSLEPRTCFYAVTKIDYAHDTQL